MAYVVDTHALAWHFANSPSLGSEARRILNRADSGLEIVYIPTIVLAELLHISTKGRTPLSFADTVSRIEAGDNYRVLPLDLMTLKAANTLSIALEMHDLLIVTTARMLNVPVITKDSMIIASRAVTIVW